MYVPWGGGHKVPNNWRRVTTPLRHAPRLVPRLQVPAVAVARVQPAVVHLVARVVGLGVAVTADAARAVRLARVAAVPQLVLRSVKAEGATQNSEELDRKGPRSTPTPGARRTRKHFFAGKPTQQNTSRRGQEGIDIETEGVFTSFKCCNRSMTMAVHGKAACHTLL